jgi:hypothetical protein
MSERLEDIKATHFSGIEPDCDRDEQGQPISRTFCMEDDDDWPCNVAYLLTLLAERDADAFTANDLSILYRLIDRYTEAAYKDPTVPRDHESHVVREALRDRVTRHLIAAQEAKRAALAGGEG